MKNLKYFRNKRLLSNTTTVLAVLVTFLMVGSAVSAVGVQQKTTTNFAEVSPNRITAVSPSTVPNDDIWDVLFSFDATAASGAAGNAGAEYRTGEFYSTRWATNLIHEYDDTGVMVDEFSIAGVSGLRDLCYDGTYFYGGAASGTIFEMDFDSETLISSITGGFQSRAIAYDSDLDVFYVSNWGDPVWIVDRSGSITGQFDLVTTTSTYGFAYDSSGPYLWVFDQTTGATQTIYQWDLTAGAFTGVTHDCEPDFSNTGIAGGLFLTDEFQSGYWTIGGLSQGTPDVIFQYEYMLAGPPPNNDTGVQNIVAPATGPAGKSGRVVRHLSARH